MVDKKKPSPEPEKAEIDMPDMEIPEMELPMMEGICPVMYGCPMMCPMVCRKMMHMPGSEEYRMGAGYMREPDWYGEDSDYSSEESDEYPGQWKQKKKYKYPAYPIFWPYFYPPSPHKKKYKKW